MRIEVEVNDKTFAAAVKFAGLLGVSPEALLGGYLDEALPVLVQYGELASQIDAANPEQLQLIAQVFAEHDGRVAESAGNILGVMEEAYSAVQRAATDGETPVR